MARKGGVSAGIHNIAGKKASMSRKGESWRKAGRKRVQGRYKAGR